MIFLNSPTASKLLPKTPFCEKDRVHIFYLKLNTQAQKKNTFIKPIHFSFCLESKK